MIKTNTQRTALHACAYIFFIGACVSFLVARDAEQESSYVHQTTLDETDQLALQTYCNTVANMFTMVQKPDDKHNVATCIGNIATGLINFVVHAITHKKHRVAYYQDLHKKLNDLLEVSQTKNGAMDATDEVESLMSAKLCKNSVSQMSAQINNLIEKMILTTLETMRRQHIHGNISGQDLASYFTNLEVLQEKIGAIITNNSEYLAIE